MRVFQFFITILLAALFLALPVEGKATTPITLKMSATQPLTHPNYLAQEYLEQLLNKRAPGRFKIIRYGGMTLGSDVEVARQVRTGLLQMATNTTTNLSNISAAFAICDLPFMFKDAKEAQAVLSGPFGKKLLDTLPPKGIQGLTYIPASLRQIFNSKWPIHTMEDIKGLKLRTPRSKIDIAAVKCIGGAATPLAFAEVYSGIQQGVIEGVTIPALLGYAMRFHEVAPYLAKIDLQCFTLVWFCNKAWFEKIPNDLKKIFMDSIQDARAWQIQNNLEQSLEVDKKLLAEGAKITAVSDDAKKPMIKAAEKVWEDFKVQIPFEYFTEIKKAKEAIQAR